MPSRKHLTLIYISEKFMSIPLKFSWLLASLTLAACGSDNIQAPNPSMDETAGPAAVAPEAEVAAKPILGNFGIDLSSRDISIRPGDDFFRHTNGLWLDTFELPADRSGYGAVNVVVDRSDERVKAIIDELAAVEPTAGSLERKISDYYLSYMDTDTLNRLGIEPLQPGLNKLAEIHTLEALTAAFGRAQIDNTATPFNFSIGANRSNPDRYQLGLSVGGFGLPDRDYYLEDTEKYIEIRIEYVAHIARVLELAGIEDAQGKAQAILQLETQIAEHTWPRAQRRNRDLTYNPMDFEEFVSEYTGFDWNAFFTAAGITDLEDLNVSFPSAMAPVIALVSELPMDDWVSFMTYRLIVDSAGVLSEEIDKESFSFYSTSLNGVPEQRQRWERGVARVGSRAGLGDAIGEVYIARHFPEAAKQQMDELVINLRSALATSISEINWMGEATKIEARLKLESLLPKIAYPNQWKDFSAIKITRDDLFANANTLREHNYREQIGHLGETTDREEWFMTPQTVNAYYNPAFNEMVFPAGILQPPMFDPAADPAVNYGSIGGIIGHEMGHGFDDQGSKSDYQGIQRNWWTEQDRANFDQLTAELAAQYDEFEPLPGYFIDGNFTLGENIGDLGGMSLAYKAYKVSLGNNEAPIIDGFTGDQRFFLAFARVWQSMIRDDALIQRLTSDPHSPAEFRVNGVVRNIDEWYEAFDVTPEDDLYLPPEDRVRIW
jgi:putative endopeptidase|tara:strand:- start:1867 stop:4026 length:2160 start_codon:yes stop_codon:yes gene_type:complete